MKAFSLQTRLAVLLATAVLVTFGFAAYVVDWRADAEMQQRFDMSLQTRAMALAALVESERNGVGVKVDASAASRFPGNAETSWYVLQCGDTVVARTADVPPVIEMPDNPSFDDAKLPRGPWLRVVALQFTPASVGVPPTSADRIPCTLRYGLDREPLDGLLGALDFILLGSLFGACLLVVLLTPWLVRRGLRPLAVLDRAMGDIGPEAPGGRLPPSDTRELAPLVARFNEVLARMDDGLARERQFASGLAHEFRTRLTELRMLVEVERRHPEGRDTRSLLDEVGSIGTELETTVTALLQLTRIQSGIESSAPEAVALAPLLARVCARQRTLAEVRQVGLDVGSADDAATVEADPNLIEIVLDNLVGNAVAYAPTGTRVAVQVKPDGIDVANAAPALHGDDLGNFGQRFWRKDAQGTGHAGLGLALAGAAARALQARLTFVLTDGVLHAALHWRGSEPAQRS